MTARSDIERVLDSFLAEGPEDVSDRAVLRALTAIDRTPQRRGLLAPWRHIRMHAPARLALMAAAVVIAAGGALYVLGPRPQAGGPAATPTLAPSPSPSPVAAGPSDDAGPPFHTATWTRFTTSRYGYTVAWPNNAYWIYSPASEGWAGQTSAEMWASTADAPWADKFYDRLTKTTLTALAVTIPAGVTEAAFIDRYTAPSAGPKPTCGAVAAASMTPIVIDGHPARLSTTCGDETVALAAFVVVGNRLYVFAESDAGQPELFSAYLSTVKLPGETPGQS
jgi:hypothetical protein